MQFLLRKTQLLKFQKNTDLWKGLCSTHEKYQARAMNSLFARIKKAFPGLIKRHCATQDTYKKIDRALCQMLIKKTLPDFK